MSTTSTNYHPPPSAPFHRLLTYYSTRSPSLNPSTIRLTDSLTGNLALGLDFPVALIIAVGRHLYLRNTSPWYSLAIHVPSVPLRQTPLHNVHVDEKAQYTRSEILGRAKESEGWSGMLDALGLWALAADTRTGLLSGEDVVGFQRGELFWAVERRRRGRGDVLPLWRGGPISHVGHSWVVGKVFGVEVYRDGGKED